MGDVNSFVDKFRIYKDISLKGTQQIKASHTNITGGSYFIPSENLEQFFEIYCKSLDNGKKITLLEVPRRDIDYGPVKVDFDFRYPVVEEEPLVIKRQYTKEHVCNIVELYRIFIKKYFNVSNEELTCFVTERSKPYKLQDEKCIRDGFHLYFNVALPYSFQHVLREMVIEQIVSNKIIEDIKTGNTIEQIVDKSVVESNNWFMYGSRKPNLEPYSLTMELDYDGNELDVSRWKRIDLVKTLSIRKEMEKKEYNSKELEAEITAKAPVKVKATPKIKEQKIALTKFCSSSLSLPENFEFIKSLINILSPERANDYKLWFEVGACLFNISENLINLWIDFSKTSPKYKDGECEQYWNLKFKKDNLGIASLIFWAKSDNPIEFEKIRRNSIRYKLENSVKSPSHYDIANVVLEMYKHQYVCVSIKNKKWYAFNGLHWEPSEQGMCIRFLLSKDIANEYIKYSVECGQKMLQLNSGDNNSENDNIISGLQERIKSANKIASCLKTTGFKDNVLRECSELFYDSTFMNKLDNNPSLIGVQNGVYDLEKREFRVGRPDDYISRKVNVPYIDFDNENPETSRKIDIINDFFNKILPIESVRKYMWLTIASCLDGNPDAKFPILTGTGGNGKTILLEFLEETFGEYACKVSTTIFTAKSSSPSTASPEIARLRNVRIVSAEETEEGSTLNVARMKELTGGNKISCRKLFEDLEEFKPQAHYFLVCNNLPKINSDDGGTWRRIHIVEFISSFVDNPEDERYEGNLYVYKKDPQISQKLYECRDVFFSYLVNVFYQEFIKKDRKIDEPKEVQMGTNAYRQENDLYFQFIKERIEKRPGHIMKIPEVYIEFSFWFKESGYDGKPPNREQLKKYFEKKFGPYGNSRLKNDGWRGYAIIPKEIDVDLNTPAIMEEKDI